MRKCRITKQRDIVFNFNASGFEVLEKYNETKNYCFDDLRVELTGFHYAKECNVMGEILLSRYDLFTYYPEQVTERSQSVISRSHHTKGRGKTYITTNLNAQELEKRYGNRVCSRMRAMFNLISFNENSKDKRN